MQYDYSGVATWEKIGEFAPVEEKEVKNGLKNAKNCQFFSPVAPIGTSGDQFTLIN